MSYAEKWDDYRSRHRLFLAVFLSYVPGVSIAGILLTRAFQSATPVCAVAVLWLSAFAVSGVRLSTFRCPRCQNWFLSTIVGS